jgi:hypothetical protein
MHLMQTSSSAVAEHLHLLVHSDDKFSCIAAEPGRALTEQQQELSPDAALQLLSSADSTAAERVSAVHILASHAEHSEETRLSISKASAMPAVLRLLQEVCDAGTNAWPLYL